MTLCGDGKRIGHQSPPNIEGRKYARMSNGIAAIPLDFAPERRMY